jgi:hypothetical protein
METHRYRVVGDPGAEKRARVRFVIGTNADLAASVAFGLFLKYRPY